jgi:hypothetical protein
MHAEQFSKQRFVELFTAEVARLSDRRPASFYTTPR